MAQKMFQWKDESEDHLPSSSAANIHTMCPELCQFQNILQQTPCVAKSLDEKAWLVYFHRDSFHWATC